jgi:hypothetical protein
MKHGITSAAVPHSMEVSFSQLKVGRASIVSAKTSK